MTERQRGHSNNPKKIIIGKKTNIFAQNTGGHQSNKATGK